MKSAGGLVVVPFRPGSLGEAGPAPSQKTGRKHPREPKSQKGPELNAAPAPNGLAGGALALLGARKPFDTLYTTTPAPEIPGKFPKISCFCAGRGRNSTPALTSPLLTSCARLHSHGTRFGTYFKVYSTLTAPFFHFRALVVLSYLLVLAWSPRRVLVVLTYLRTCLVSREGFGSS